MSDKVVGAADADLEAANTPEDLGHLFVARASAADVDGLVALYEPEAVLALPDGRNATGHAEIRQAYEALVLVRSNFSLLEQPPALICGDLALTSSRTPTTVTAEVARRQPDGTWLWILDRPAVTGRAGTTGLNDVRAP